MGTTEKTHEKKINQKPVSFINNLSILHYFFSFILLFKSLFSKGSQDGRKKNV